MSYDVTVVMGPAFARTDGNLRPTIHFPTRFNSAVSASSASASITPPHSVMPLRNHDAFRRRIEALQRRMQQKRLAVIAGMIAGLRDHDEVRPQADDRLQRGKSAEGESRDRRPR